MPTEFQSPAKMFVNWNNSLWYELVSCVCIYKPAPQWDFRQQELQGRGQVQTEVSNLKAYRAQSHRRPRVYRPEAWLYSSHSKVNSTRCSGCSVSSEEDQTACCQTRLHRDSRARKHTVALHACMRDCKHSFAKQQTL